MPGHSQAALAAYPELGCENKQVEVATKWGVFTDVYCPTETTFKFLENVLDEVTALFPYEYLHIGGDECPKDSWKKSNFCQNLIKEKGLKDEHGLQSYFIGRMANYLKTKNKTIIGWDEILEGGLNEGSIVMSWRGTEGGVAAAKEGHKVIMTPGSHCYFDHYQSPSSSEPVAIGGLTTVKDVYGYEVIPSELSKDESKFVWGAQGNVWTEYMPNFGKVEYMALARMTALSEVLHNNIDKRDYEKYQKRLASHTRFWKKRLVNIADHQLDVQITASTKSGEGSTAFLESDYPNAKFYCILPNKEIVPVREGKHHFSESGNYEFYCQSEEQTGNKEAINYVHHLATKANITLSEPASEAYPGSGPSAIINGIIGSGEKYGGPEWLGFAGKDFEAKIELSSTQKLSGISCRFFNGEGQWIYLPSEIEIEISNDGKKFTPIAKQQPKTTPEKINTVKIDLDTEARFVRVIARNHGIIEEGKQGAGHKAWLFVDEIIIN
ncbi:family 20 glycosylhydrolase, partial [Saprospiraceae bacterium]|nr:family 20 glycosylhydrolase [Saprospiraceae bacterium]